MIATLNIKGLASRIKVEMLEDFLRRQEIDYLFLQEVVHCTIEKPYIFIIPTTMWDGRAGHAMVTRNEITITSIKRLLSGR